MGSIIPYIKQPTSFFFIAHSMTPDVLVHMLGH